VPETFRCDLILSTKAEEVQAPSAIRRLIAPTRLETVATFYRSAIRRVIALFRSGLDPFALARSQVRPREGYLGSGSVFLSRASSPWYVLHGAGPGSGRYSQLARM